MKAAFQSCRIEGIAAAVPRQQVDLTSLTDTWDLKTIQKITTATGITKVRIALPSVTASDLCFSAAQTLIAAMNIDAGTIDGLVFVTQSPDFPLPSTGPILQHRLGLKKDVVTFDINLGCSGYVYGLLQADLMIHSGMCRRVLVLSGDTITRYVSDKDRSARMVFGDGGSATLVAGGNERELFDMKTDGSGAAHIIVSAGGHRRPSTSDNTVPTEREEGNIRSDANLYMNGMEVTTFAVREIPEIVSQLVKDAGWTINDVDLFALHQANAFILGYIAKKLRVDTQRMPFACGEIGNTSAASIPVMLAQKVGQFAARPLSKVVLCGFGVGLSWGAMTTSLADTRILPLQEV